MSSDQHNKNKYLTKRQDQKLRFLQGHHRWIHQDTDYTDLLLTDFPWQSDSPLQILFLTTVDKPQPVLKNMALQPKTWYCHDLPRNSSSGWKISGPPQKGSWTVHCTQKDAFDLPQLWSPPRALSSHICQNDFVIIVICQTFVIRQNDLILPKFHQIRWSIWGHIEKSILYFLPQSA